jgi:hypothetical protein
LRTSTAKLASSGSGVVTRALAPKLSPGASYVVTDLNLPMLDYAASRQPADDRIKWRQADALALLFDFGAQVLGYLVVHYWGHRSGWPDLLVYRADQWFLAEIKSWRDKLNENQKRWIEDNHRYLHLPFKLVQVHRLTRYLLMGFRARIVTVRTSRCKPRGS